MANPQIPCKSGKIRYATAAEAQELLPILKRRGRGNLCVYRCEDCQDWHLGRTRTVRTRAAKARRRELAASE
jgi:hypothetical protein